MAGEEMKKSKENAQSLLASFDDLAERLGVPHEAIHEHELADEIPNLAAKYARLSDLTIIISRVTSLPRRLSSSAASCAKRSKKRCRYR